jgi:hypothetical protein
LNPLQHLQRSPYQGELTNGQTEFHARIVLPYLAYRKKYLEEAETAAVDHDSASEIRRANSQGVTANFEPVASPLIFTYVPILTFNSFRGKTTQLSNSKGIVNIPQFRLNP